MASKKKRFLIIDTNSLVHRAFHALPPLSDTKGEMVNAVYGFLLAFFKAVKEFEPEYAAAAFDFPAPTKREKRFPQYKEKREPAPDELYRQIPLVKDVLSAFHVPVFEKEGFEADDIIATLASLAEKRQAVPGVQTVVLSGDADLLQLVDKNTRVCAMRKGIGDSVLFDEKKVRERFGVGPALVADWKGLRGDPSDNIPGVRGVGEKTATQLLLAAGSLEGLYKELEEGKDVPGVTEKLKETLLAEKDIAFLSKDLATLDKKVPLDFRLSSLTWQGFDRKEAKKALSQLTFSSLLSRMPDFSGKEQERSSKATTKEKIEHLFKEGVLSEELYELETKLSPVLRSMETTGILIDKAFFKKLSKQVGEFLLRLEKSIVEKARTPFNINSPKQLSEVLFEKMGISAKGLHKTPGGVVSTASSELEKLSSENPIAKDILKYRELSKLQNTYLLPLPGLADKEGRIHTTLDQLGAATGRLSSSAPNLQNIPLQGEWGKKIRQGFVAERGYSLASFDYSQVELRIASHIAGEEKMQEAFLKEKDIHTETASRVFGVPENKVGDHMRFRAKALNFGILYGMGARGFAESAEISYEEAQDFIDSYFLQFPHIKAYMEDTISFVQEHGYAQTLLGRKRFLPDIHSATPHIRAAAERVAINHPIQGTAADIMKMAMVKAAEELNLKQKECRMLLQIHDELLFEISDDIVEQQSSKIKELMESVVSLKVPLTVKASSGKNWGELSPLL